MEIDMDNWTFGFTMIIVGMGGTLAVLALFAVFMVLLKKIFPFREENIK
jgi:Na+-transporting methylmalonyl-CoA/oxaloacetate decarboxylase gamma subunit